MAQNQQRQAESSIATLTANPAIDISTSVERIAPFHKLRCTEARRDPGGGGINVARVLRRFGLDAKAIFPSGGSVGQLLQQLVKEEGIESLSTPIPGETREDFTVTEQASGGQFRFVLPGPALSEEECQALLDALDRLEPRPGFVVASGSLPAGAPIDLFARAAGIAAANGAKMVIDTSGPALAAALSHPLYLVKPNLREFRELVQAPVDTEAQRVKAARELIEAKNIGMIALTLADEGALLVTRKEAWRGRAPKVKPVSTVGAGDSFLGAMISRLILGRSHEDALRFAVAAGTAALLSPGTDLCRPEDVDRLLPQVSIEAL